MDKANVVADKYTIVEPGRTRNVYTWFQHFSQESFEREFAEAGFAVKGDILTSLESRITANRANLQPLPIRYRQDQE